MPTAPVSDDFQNLKAAQQKVLRSLEVAGELLEELSKLGRADQAVVQKQCEEYLQNLKEVEEIVIPAIEKYSRSSPHQGNSQLARAQALAAASHLETLLEESAPLEGSTPQAMAQPAANGDAEPMDTN